MSVVKEIVFLRGRPEFKAVNEIANLLLQPARSTKKRRRLNDGQHLDTGHREEKGRQEEKEKEEEEEDEEEEEEDEEEEEEVISQRC